MQLPRLDVALRDAVHGAVESRWVAAVALGQAHGARTEEAIGTLVRLTGDPSPEVRVQAIEGLAEQARGGVRVPAEPITRALWDRSIEVRCAAVEASVDMLDDPAAEIARLAHDRDPSVRATAARALGIVQASGEIEILTALLTDSHEPVRAAAAIALSDLGNRAGEAVLVQLLKQRGQHAEDAAVALGLLGISEAAEALYSVLSRWTTPKALKGVLAAAMARCGDARGSAHLAEMLESKRSSQRMAALSALTRLPVSDVAPAVGRIIGRTGEIEASSAICALVSIGRIDRPAARAALAPREITVTGELLQELQEALASLEKGSLCK